MKNIFTDEELGEMRTLIENVADGKMGAQHTAPIVAVFEQRLKKPSKDLPREEERLDSGCSITTWLMLSRSLSKWNHL